MPHNPTNEPSKYDIFISYASEDRDQLPGPLAKKLKEVGLKVWYDVFQLKWGDSVISSINEGILNSSMWIPILSKSFFEKKWSTTELNAFVTLMSMNEKKLFPILYNIEHSDILEKYPMLSSIFPKQWDGNMESLVNEIKTIIQEKKQDIEQPRHDENAEIAKFYAEVKKLKQNIRIEYDLDQNAHASSIPSNIFKIKGFENANVGEKYVPQLFIHKSQTHKNAVKFILNSMQLGKASFTILGGYGNGKSEFCYDLLYSLCEKQDNLPIYIPLGKLNFNGTIKQFINLVHDYVEQEYELSISTKSFKKLCNDGKITFIFDALDEMSKNFEKAVVIDYLAEILNLAKKNTIILTCRNNFASDADVKDKLEQIQDSIEIIEFDEKLIEQFIIKKCEKNQLKIDKINTLIEKKKIGELAKHPFFLNSICDYVDDIQNFEIINEATVLDTLTKKWITHEVKKDKSTLDDELIEVLLEFAEIAAISEYSSKPMTIEEIREELDHRLKSVHNFDKIKIDKVCKSLPYCTFLNINSDRRYTFKHQPLLEYFIAKKVVRDIEEKSGSFFDDTHRIFGQDILDFIYSIFEKKIPLLKLLVEQTPLNEPISNDSFHNFNQILKNLGSFVENKGKNNVSNVVQIIHTLHGLSPRFDFTNSNFEGANLRQINFSKYIFNGSNFKHVKSEGSNFRKAELNNTQFNNANLSNADCSDAKFHNSIFIRSNLSYSNLKNAQLNNANLSGADLTGANLSGADLTGANLSGTNLTHVDLSDVKFYDESIDVSNTLITNVFGVNFQDANMFHTDLEGVYLPNANFSGAFMWSCDLAGANLQGAIFSNAVLQYVRIKDTRLKNAVFSNIAAFKSPILGNENIIGLSNLESQEYHKQNTEIIPPSSTLFRFKKFCKYLCPNPNNFIRHVSIIDKTRLILVDQWNENLGKPVLQGEHKSILVHYSWISWKLLKHIEGKGKDKDERKYAVGVFQQLKIVTIPIGEFMMIITMPVKTDHRPIINWINQNSKYVLKNESDLEEFDFNAFEIDKDEYYLTSRPIRDDVNIISKRLLENKQVHFVGIYDKNNQQLNTQNYAQSESFQFHDLITEDLINDMWRRWNYRLKFKHNIGKPRYSITKYDQKQTISALIGDEPYLMLIITDPQMDENEIIGDIP